MRWNVGTKIGTGFAVAIVIFLIVGAVSYQSTEQLVDASDRRRHTYEVLSGLDQVLAVTQDVQIGQRGFALTGDDSYLEPYHAAVGRFDTHMQEVRRVGAGDSRFEQRLSTLERLVRDFLALAAETVNAIRTKGTEAGVALIRTGGGKALTDQIRDLVDRISREETTLLTERIAEANATARRTGWTIALGMLTALVVGALAGFLITRDIATPLGELTRVAERITVGDLSVDVPAQVRADEVGVLARSFDRMTRSLRSMAATAGQVAGGDLRSTVTPQSPQDLLGNAFAQMVANFREQLRELHEGANVLAAAATQIVASTAQLASSASQSAAAVSETTTTVEEVRQTAQVASQKAQYVFDMSQKAAHISQNGRKSTEDTAIGMDRIRQQMEAIAASMVRLNEQTQTVGQIIATVEDLAAQSNLLAVNAAIEAAKAGEHGKGFAVVAQEVRNLAGQSRQATTEVRTILTEIQKAASTAVLATEQGSRAVEAGARQTEVAGESIQTLAGSVSDAAQAATQIAASSQQQLVGVDQVAAAMESIKQASAQNVVGAKQLESAARNLSDLGQRLKQIVQRYQL